MRESTDSAPTAVTSITTRPSPFTLPPVTRDPTCLGTGSDSPVSMDSSTWVLPSSTRPSAGKRSPGRTDKRSRTINSATGTSSSPKTPITCARSGRKACSARMAAVVCTLALVSSHLPSSTSVITTADPS